MGFRTALGLKRRSVKPAKVKIKKRPALNAILWARAAESSADFVEPHLRTAVLFDQRADLHRYALDEALREGLLLEFGVFKGESINAFADQLAAAKDPRPIYGFDAFKGLQENWNGLGYPASRIHFNRDGKVPDVLPNVRIVPGWIDQTLPKFLAENDGPIAFMHVDTDTYTPARLALNLCKHRLVVGSLVLFDELLAYPGWQDTEYRALAEEISESHYEWIGFSGARALLRVVKTIG